MSVPRLSNDCFALPPGVDWTPVDTALERLRDALVPVAQVDEVPLAQAGGRVLAEAVRAPRAHPPFANAAVDGYAFAHASLPDGEEVALPLHPGRAAAGEPFAGVVPEGSAVRTLTGAAVPGGTDTVILQEDVVVEGDQIRFRPGLRKGANTRPAGEDIEKGANVFDAGRRLGPMDLAVLASVGARSVAAYRPLRVAVLSTGNELAADGAEAAEGQIHDANRPMLLDLIRRWGHVPVDLGQARDTRADVIARLDRGAAEADAILTSGGASAGEEDHISATLSASGSLVSWRIAVKPGRPLALALWQGTPVFGLPGNPVAAFVCTLIFGRPALGLLAGQGWRTSRGIAVPAAFSKSKKPGRREYLRARLNAEGAAEVFASEGSGRVSGLAWADGLVELPDGALQVAPGHPVLYHPYGNFGL